VFYPHQGKWITLYGTSLLLNNPADKSLPSSATSGPLVAVYSECHCQHQREDMRQWLPSAVTYLTWHVDSINSVCYIGSLRKIEVHGEVHTYNIMLVWLCE